MKLESQAKAVQLDLIKQVLVLNKRSFLGSMETRRKLIILAAALVSLWIATITPELLGTFRLTLSIWHDRGNEVLYYQRGQLRQMHGNHKGALKDFDRVLRIAIHDQSSSISLASSYFGRGQAYYLLAGSPLLNRKKVEEYYILAISDYRTAAELSRESDNLSSENLAKQKIEIIQSALLELEN
ncbi:MAG: hypothetical protein KME14_07700 [Tildeniella torsiva UHER 1998/13D]|nr:hypothetical protein [Tildeniella torsiva UHER 1998/13D]